MAIQMADTVIYLIETINDFRFKRGNKTHTWIHFLRSDLCPPTSYILRKFRNWVFNQNKEFFAGSFKNTITLHNNFLIRGDN